MRIYLLRHGSAEPRGPDGADSTDRKLVEKGLDQCQRLGETLARIGLEFDRVLSSPYHRARETAAAVLAAMESEVPVVQSEALAPGASVRGAIDDLFSGAQRAPLTVLAVGHEPQLSAMAAMLIGGEFASIDLRKGGVAELDVISADPPRAELMGLIRPRYLRGL